MATVKNGIYQVDNGVDFDEIHFRTNENMIINQSQSLAGSGYRKLPGGLIIQWGRVNVPAGEYNGYTGTFATLPISFPNEILNASATLSHSVESEKYIIKELSIAADAVTNKNLAFRYSHTGNFILGGIQINYIAIGW